MQRTQHETLILWIIIPVKGISQGGMQDEAGKILVLDANGNRFLSDCRGEKLLDE
jgi:hypothetical protein